MIIDALITFALLWMCWKLFHRIQQNARNDNLYSGCEPDGTVSTDSLAIQLIAFDRESQIHPGIKHIGLEPLKQFLETNCREYSQAYEDAAAQFLVPSWDHLGLTFSLFQTNLILNQKERFDDYCDRIKPGWDETLDTSGVSD